MTRHLTPDAKGTIFRRCHAQTTQSRSYHSRRTQRRPSSVRTDRPAREEIRILTCRQTSASIIFHLGPPLLLRHTASEPHARAGKLLPFPSVPRTPAKNK